jgi:hypothetical protein
MLYFHKAFDLVGEMVMIYLKSLKPSLLLIPNQVRKFLKTFQYFQLKGILINKPKSHVIIYKCEEITSTMVFPDIHWSQMFEWNNS